ncbi:MAG: hypothetical protein Q4C46_07810 [Bacillota bacterium]|nr:hypothetical protein [Bacillota bacterium]
MDKSSIKKTWDYTYLLTKRYDWLVTTLIIVLITNVLIAIILAFAAVICGIGIIELLIECSFIFWIIFGIYLLSCVITLLFYKGKYRYEYILTEIELKSHKGKLGIVPFNHEMTVNERIGSCFTYDSVSRLTLLRDRNEIRVRGFMTLTSVYADDEDIDEVWDILTAVCKKAKVFIRG